MSEHDNRVASLIEYMKKEGINIKMAALPKYPEPVSVGRHEPDIIGKNSSIVAIGEAKTEEDYNSEHSREQYEDFGKSKADKVYLHLPYRLFGEMWNILAELGVKRKYTLVYYSKERV